MIRVLFRRLLILLPLLFVVATIVFLFLRMIPGDPVEAMLGEGAKAADIQAIRHELLLDRPFLAQYGLYLGGILRGDFGQSWSLKTPVSLLIWKRLPATALLALSAVAVAILLAFPMGFMAARKANSWTDRILMVFAVAGGAMPTFWLGPLLILLFSIALGWFPVSGYGTFAHLVLPALTLGTALTAILVRMLRSSLLEESHSDYVRTARAKGLSTNQALFRHALRNALLPVVTLLGLQFGSLLTGAIITETIFSWPGLGRLLIQAIYSRDYPLVQGCILVFALVYAIVNLAVDVLNSALDPRIRTVQ